MPNPTIVIVDDSSDVLELQGEALAGMNVQVVSFSDPQKAWQRIQQGNVQLVVTDWEMPGISGLDLLFRINGLQRPPSVVFLTGCGSVDRAVQALSHGAIDFIEKPFMPDVYMAKVSAALERSYTQESNGSKPSGSKTHEELPEKVAVSVGMKRVFESAKAASVSDISVLLLGESGVGKEVIADFIHRSSKRSQGPFIKVNCGALPDNLVESELFGHEKGSFTGADRRRAGRFEQAHGGTLFLDEIGELPLSLQVKLLRALQEKVIQRVGGDQTITVDFRLVSATNKDLTKAVAKGEFREDLLYRINVVPIRIPALRQHVEDIASLTKHFAGVIASSMKVPQKEVSSECLACLEKFPWPGNVRQLRNAIEYAVVMGQGTSIGAEDLPEDVRVCRIGPEVSPASEHVPGEEEPASDTSSLDEGLQRYEHRFIEKSLIRHQWDIQKVMDELKISRSRLYDRIKAFGIKRP